MATGAGSLCRPGPTSGGCRRPRGSAARVSNGRGASVAPALRLRWAAGESAEAPRRAVEARNGALEIRGAELGPRRLDEAQLRVRALPQQEVAESLLAAGADHQIGLQRCAGV